MKTRLPPPVVLLIAGAGVWIIDRIFPALRIDREGQAAIAIMVALIAVGIMLAAAVWFFRYQTTVNPLSPERASRLITQGPFALSRNPIYLADAFLLVAWMVWVGNPAGIIMLPAFVLYLTHYQIRPEEQALASRFGEEYRAYCRRTRRWI